MAGFTASWVHGTAVVAEEPPGEDGGLGDFNHFGWGTQIRIRPGFSRWFHIAIPTPVYLDGERMKLTRVFLQWQQIAGYPRAGQINDAHLWDGQQRIAKSSAKDFKQSGYATIAGHRTYELKRPREWFFGVGLSFQLSAIPYADGDFIPDHKAPVFVIGSAGADFEV